MIRITDILDKIEAYNPGGDLDIIDRAYIYSARVHDGQTRLSGEPYLSHPLEVADILADIDWMLRALPQPSCTMLLKTPRQPEKILKRFLGRVLPISFPV